MAANELKHETHSRREDELAVLDLALKCFERAAVLGLVISLFLIATALPSYL